MTRSGGVRRVVEPATWSALHVYRGAGSTPRPPRWSRRATVRASSAWSIPWSATGWGPSWTLTSSRPPTRLTPPWSAGPTLSRPGSPRPSGGSASPPGPAYTRTVVSERPAVDVSVVIPCYNHGQYLPEAIASAEAARGVQGRADRGRRRLDRAGHPGGPGRAGPGRLSRDPAVEPGIVGGPEHGHRRRPGPLHPAPGLRQPHPSRLPPGRGQHPGPRTGHRSGVRRPRDVRRGLRPPGPGLLLPAPAGGQLHRRLRHLPQAGVGGVRRLRHRHAGPAGLRGLGVLDPGRPPGLAVRLRARADVRLPGAPRLHGPALQHPREPRPAGPLPGPQAPRRLRQLPPRGGGGPRPDRGRRPAGRPAAARGRGPVPGRARRPPDPAGRRHRVAPPGRGRGGPGRRGPPGGGRRAGGGPGRAGRSPRGADPAGAGAGRGPSGDHRPPAGLRGLPRAVRPGGPALRRVRRRRCSRCGPACSGGSGASGSASGGSGTPTGPDRPAGPVPAQRSSNASSRSRGGRTRPTAADSGPGPTTSKAWPAWAPRTPTRR